MLRSPTAKWVLQLLFFKIPQSRENLIQAKLLRNYAISPRLLNHGSIETVSLILWPSATFAPGQLSRISPRLPEIPLPPLVQNGTRVFPDQS